MSKVKVRVLVETYGVPRDPIARRGDIIEVDRAEVERAPGTFEDIEAVAAAKVEASRPTIDPDFEAQRKALQAEREASAVARAINADREAERIKATAQAFRRETGATDVVVAMQPQAKAARR